MRAVLELETLMPGRTTARGYGSAHQRKRADAEREVKAGRAVCWRCGQDINPDEPWDLGHDDDDRRHYMGPEHRYCNRAAGAAKGNRSRTRPRPWQSRTW